MIRPFTCVCMLLAAGSGLYLYQTKHRAQLLDREIARTYKQIDQAHERTNALKAEWALLNEPDRLKELADQHTALHTLATTQFVAMNDLSARLPAPLPPGPPAIPADDAATPVAATPAQMPVAAAKPVAAAARVAANDRPVPTPEKAAADKPAQAVAVAHAAPAKPSAPVSVAAAVLPLPRPVTSPAPRFLAPVVAVSAGTIGAAPATAPGTVGESVLRANRVHAETASAYSAPPSYTSPSYTPPTYRPPAYAQPGYVQPAYTQPSYAGSPAASAVSSALGSAAHTALPPPVPFGAAQSGG